jgi:two-component system phosphate regulon response regulator PhoB/two-component system alkaline phosphatase synthesis response regulator PhoP
MSANSILVVDDDMAILDMVAELLGYEGYEVLTSNSGSDALIQAKDHAPRLILLDLMMPEMSGWQVVSALRSAPQTRTIPVVLLSARRDLAATAQDLGVEHFLEKPFDVDELLGVVGKYMLQ